MLRFRFIIAIFITLTILFLYPLIFHPSSIVATSGDLLGPFTTWQNFLYTSVRSYGQLPLWDPYEFSGTPFISNPQVGIFYPFNLFYFLFPSYSFFDYLIVVDIFLTSIFTYLFARSIKQSISGSLFTTIVYTFSGTLLLRIYAGHVLILSTLTWFPLLLFGIEKLIQTEKIQYMYLIIASVALMFFAGHTQIFLYVLTTAIAYFALRISTDRTGIHRFKILMYFSVSLFVGICITAMQLLPIVEFAKSSGRGAGVSFDFASSYSLPPIQLLSYILPFLFGSPLDQTFWGKGNFHELQLYIGIIPLLLIAITFFRKKLYYEYISLFLFVFSLLFSFGKYTPFYSFFYHFIPGFNSTRVPARFLFLTTFSLAILSGYSLEKFVNNLKRKWYWEKVVLLSLILCSLVVFIITYAYKTTIISWIHGHYFLQKYFYLTNMNALWGDIQESICRLVGFLLIFFILIYIARYSSKRIMVSLLTFVVLIDLFTFNNRFITVKPIVQTLPSSKVLNKILADKGTYRVFDLPGMLYEQIPKDNIQSITGIGPLYVGNYRDFVWNVGSHENTPYEGFFLIHDIHNLAILNELNVKYVIVYSGQKIPQLKLIYKDPTYWLYKNDSYYPRVFFITQDNVKNFNTFYITSYTPNKITIKGTNTQKGILFLSEVWYPGWNAYDNTKEIKIDKKDNLFRSLQLSSGKHNITFVYQPFSYTLGRWISLVSIGGVFIFLFFQIIVTLGSGKIKWPPASR